jgi:hypothetical protein
MSGLVCVCVCVCVCVAKVEPQRVSSFEGPFVEVVHPHLVRRAASRRVVSVTGSFVPEPLRFQFRFVSVIPLFVFE